MQIRFPCFAGVIAGMKYRCGNCMHAAVGSRRVNAAVVVVVVSASPIISIFVENFSS